MPSPVVATIPTSVVANDANAQVKGWLAVDAGGSAVGQVTVHGVGLRGDEPTYDVRRLALYESGTDRLVAVVDHPMPLISQGRGTRMAMRVVRSREQTSQWALPASELRSAKSFVFVVDASINDSVPRRVRSSDFQV